MSLSDELESSYDGEGHGFNYCAEEAIKEFIQKIKKLRIVRWSVAIICPICLNLESLWIRKDNPKDEMCFDCAIDKEAGKELTKNGN